MNYEEARNPILIEWHLKRLAWTSIFVISIISLWFLPITSNICRQIDTFLAIKFNNSLDYSPFWIYFWGYLNHPNETWLNVIFMISINIIATILIKNKNFRIRALVLTIYFWLFFQIGLLVSNFLFSKLLQLHRLSPSLIIEPWVSISVITNIPSFKDYSYNSFPSGHAFALFYWAMFTSLYAPKYVKRACYGIACLLCLPRLFSGAHWVSDVIGTLSFAMLWFTLAIATPVYGYIVNKFVNKIEKLLN